MNKKDLILVRDKITEDQKFIHNTWLIALYHGNDWFKEIDFNVFNSNYEKVINGIIAKPSVQIKIACLKEQPDVILAYAVYEGDILHWAYCKEAWRGIGIAKDLIPLKDITTVTHLSKIGRAIRKYNYPHLKFNPFAI